MVFKQIKYMKKIISIAIFFIFIISNIGYCGLLYPKSQDSICKLRVPIGQGNDRSAQILSLYPLDEAITSTRQEPQTNISPKVAIIILHYGRDDSVGESDTMELLENLQNLNYSNYEIILLDNNSPDGFFLKYKNILHSRFPKFSRLIFIRSDVNLGFAEGNNLAMEHALGDDVDYFFLLNNDTVVDKDSLQNLVKVAESSEDVGAVGPKIYYYDRPDVIAGAGS